MLVDDPAELHDATFYGFQVDPFASFRKPPRLQSTAKPRINRAKEPSAAGVDQEDEEEMQAQAQGQGGDGQQDGHEGVQE